MAPDIRQEGACSRRGCSNDDFGADVAASAWPVLDDELLTQPLRQRLTGQPRDDVGRNTSRETDDDPNWPPRIIERQSGA